MYVVKSCMYKFTYFYIYQFQYVPFFTKWSFVLKYVSNFARFFSSAGEETGFFDNIQDDEIEVLQQMFFGVVLCAFATLAAKGDLVFTSIFMGAVAAMAGYWLSDKSDRLMDTLIRGR